MVTIKMPAFNVKGDQVAFWDFLDECLSLHADWFKELCEEERTHVLREYPFGFADEHDADRAFQEADGAAYGRFVEMMEDVWNDDRNEAFRRFAERESVKARALARRAAEAERRLQDMTRRAEDAEAQIQDATYAVCGMQARMETWEAPPVCKCGAVSYHVRCSVCHRDLGPTYRCEDN
jgi:hypothetical protein